MRVLLVAALLWATNACHPCREAGIAALVQAKGSVERDYSTQRNAWESTEVGARFDFGDALRTRPKARAVVHLDAGASIALRENSTVRFMNAAPGAPQRLQILTGEAEIETDDGFELRSIVGRARIERGVRTRLVVRAAENEVAYRVLVGRATLDQDGETTDLSAGATRTIRVGQAEVESPEPAGPSEVVTPPEPEVPTVVDPPDRPDFVVASGGTFTVHLARPPVLIGLTWGTSCPRGGAVEILRGARVRTSVRALTQAVLALPVGSHPYRTRCVVADADAPTLSEGTITVVPDSGTARLPRTAPASVVDTDGRRYTVLYQTRLPQITVRWRDAPPAEKYVLTVESSGGNQKRVESARPAHAFASGVLGEGTHSVRFATVDGSLSSRVTSLGIVYDNASPKASVREPRDRSFSLGEPTAVSGIALPGWGVSVEGAAIDTDPAGRFAGTATALAGQDALAIRLAHADRGVHYYVRRARGR